MSPLGSKIFTVATGVLSALTADLTNVTSGQISVVGYSTPIDLSSHFNGKAASEGLGGHGNFDNLGGSYPAKYLPNGTFTWEGVKFSLPPFQTTSNDTIVSNGQTLSVPNGQYFSLNALLAVNGAGNPIADSFNVTYTDGSQTSASFIAQSWWGTNPSDGAIKAPFFYSNATTVNHNASHIYGISARLDLSKSLQSITLPHLTSSYKGNATLQRRVNVFALSLYSFNHTIASVSAPSPSSIPPLSVQWVRSTTKFVKSTEGETVQTVQLALTNVPGDLNSSSTGGYLNGNYTVALKSRSVETVQPAPLHRLAPNDQVRLQVGIVNAAGTKVGDKASVAVVIKDATGCVLFESAGWNITAGIPEYENTDKSLASHESPDWYNDAKFGIFVHWGVYAVPAWSLVGKQYAEWYWWNQHNPANASSATWQHHLDTYGPNVVYDDFIDSFGHDFNPKDLVDLFEDAGAKYFVLVSKHHDGFALFDTGKTSNRNSLKLGPKRDFVKEIFDAAKTYHPDLHRGLYFSLPEWFHPDYLPYGEASLSGWTSPAPGYLAISSWPGGLAHLAYNKTGYEPYTGYVHVNDYIQDLQKPQLETLFYQYDTEILWCDIGGATAFPSIGGEWFNAAAAQNRSVVFNNRCGANFSDFDTPEYATYSAVQERKWESSEGLDPFSYGYNAATPDYAYRNVSDIIATLVDIVSKNGNYLLDIGPMANGTVVAAMTQRLREVGRWLKQSGDSVFGTQYWFATPAYGSLRFTTAVDAFYIISLQTPSTISIPGSIPVPILPGDEVTLLGGSGKALNWTKGADNTLTIELPQEEVSLVQYAWSLKIRYK